MIKKLTVCMVVALFIVSCKEERKIEVKIKQETKINKEVKKMETSVMEITDGSFEETIKNGVTLVDFWASWCGPCQMQIPILDKVAKELGDSAKIAKMNVDENRSIPIECQVSTIPTLIVFKDGKVVKRFVGVQQQSVLVSVIKENL